MPAIAAVAAHGDQQPAQRLVSQPSSDRVPRHALSAAAPAPVIALDDTAREYRAVRFQALADHAQRELIKAAEGRQISSVEPSIGPLADGSARHVEIFRVGV